MLSDLKIAFRTLAKSPGFTLVAVLSLGIGIGAGTAIFSLLNAVLLRPLPVRDPHELRLLNWAGVNPQIGSYSGDGKVDAGGVAVRTSFSYPMYGALAEGDALGDVFAFSPLPRLTCVAGGAAATTSGLMVSADFFEAYGASTHIGRPFTAEDDRLEAAPVAVVTHRMWEQRFGLDPHVLGQSITLNQHTFTIVGVLPRTYVGPLPGDPADVYVTFAAQPLLVPNRPVGSSGHWWVQIMARLRPAVSDEQAAAAWSVVFRQQLAASNARMDRPEIRIESGAQGSGMVIRRRLVKPMFALFAVVAVVLSIACANVAGLLIARGAAREHEFALRAAIGASRWALLRQSFAESLLLGLAAGGAGLVIAEWGKAGLLRIVGKVPESFRFDLHTDLAVLVFTLGVSLVTVFAFGILPAWRASRVDALDGLKRRSSAACPRLRLGKLLVSLQVVLSVLLVVGASLMTRSFANLVHVDPGFKTDNILLFRVDPGQAGYKDGAIGQFYSEAGRSLARIPGVQSVSLCSLPLVGQSSTSYAIQIPGQPGKGRDADSTSELVVSPTFFDTFGIAVLAGRRFAESDTATSLPVAVVNETFARSFFPGEYPIGRTFVIQDGRSTAVTIIAIARDVKYAEIRESIPPVMYLCTAQHERRAMYFAIKSVLPVQSVLPSARKGIAALNPNLPLSAINTQNELINRSLAVDRLFAGSCGGLAVIGLLLACLGLYGLTAYDVTRRTREIGIRLALGAEPGGVARSFVVDALVLACAGIAVGVPIALALARLVRTQLYGVSPSDPVSFALGVVLLAGVAGIAAWLPARRAAQVNPLEALRAE